MQVCGLSCWVQFLNAKYILYAGMWFVMLGTVLNVEYSFQYAAAIFDRFTLSNVYIKKEVLTRIVLNIL